MSERFVLDASALMAMLLDEPGSEFVYEHHADASMSSVNFCEVVSYYVERGEDAVSAAQRLARLQLDVIPFDAKLAVQTAALRGQTRRRGLSLGDRACIATAKALDLPVLTADRAWRDVDVGVAITLIR